MASVKESLSFGQYLQALRLEKKISLEKISEETRVALSILRLIEREDHDNLPDEVFVKGFLRSFAQAVGADGDEAVRRYESRLRVLQKLDGTSLESDTATSGRWLKLLLVSGLFLTLIAVTISGLVYIDHYLSGRAKHAEQSVVQMTPVAKSQPMANSGAQVVSQIPENEKYKLQITVHEDTWMKIIVDNQNSQKYDLKAGEDLKLEAISNFSLLIGNAAGVKITLNDKPIAVSGKSGEVVNLDLP